MQEKESVTDCLTRKKVWRVYSNIRLCAPHRHPETSHLSPLTSAAQIRRGSALPHTPRVSVCVRVCALSCPLCPLCMSLFPLLRSSVVRNNGAECVLRMRIHVLFVIKSAFVCVHMCKSAQHPHESIKSYSCCKSDMFLFTAKPSNCWLRLLWQIPDSQKSQSLQEKQSCFYYRIGYDFFSLWGWIDEQSRPSTSLLFNHLCDAITENDSCCAQHKNKPPWLYATFWAACVVEWLKILKILAVKCYLMVSICFAKAFLTENAFCRPGRILII